MKNTQSQRLFFALLCATQIAVNTFGMENEIPKLLPEIQGKIVTTIIDLYLNEFEDAITAYYQWCQKQALSIEFRPSKDDKNFSLYKMLYWINRTRFKPLQGYVDLNTTSRSGNTILHHTIHAGIECIDRPLINKTNTNHSTLAKQQNEHLSNCNGNVDMVNFAQYLLIYKANPNIQNNSGKSPFFESTRSIFTRLTQLVESTLINLLLDNGADPNIAIKDESFAFTLVSKNYSQAIERILKKINLKAIMYRENEYGDIVAFNAIDYCNIGFLQVLADAGQDFGIANSKGQTPLDYALKYQDRITTTYGTERTEKMINLLQSITNTNKQTLKEQQ
jgi:ankyrin repeat protein